MAQEIQELCRVVEPNRVEDYANVVTKAVDGDVVVLQRNGADVAVIVPIAYLELLQESVAREIAERLAKKVDWKRLAKTSPPPQSWFDNDEPKPF